MFIEEIKRSGKVGTMLLLLLLNMLVLPTTIIIVVVVAVVKKESIFAWTKNVRSGVKFSVLTLPPVVTHRH